MELTNVNVYCDHLGKKMMFTIGFGNQIHGGLGCPLIHQL